MWARSLFRTTASGVLSRTSPCDVQAGLLVGFIRSPGMSESANGSNEVWFVPSQSPCFLRPCWTAFLNSLQIPKHPARRFREECGGEPLRFTASSLQRVTFVNVAERVRQQCRVRTPLADCFRILLGLLPGQLRFCRCVSQFVGPSREAFFQHCIDGRDQK